jgi:hypothetical protein
MRSDRRRACGRRTSARSRVAVAGRAVALGLLGLVAGRAVSAATTYTAVTQPGFATRTPGPDAHVGTQDDVVPLPLPGDDGIGGTADDLFANPAGAASYLRFAQLPLGGDYDVFATGTLVVQSFGGPPSLREATVFDLAANTAQTNGLVGSLSDVKFLPHFVRLGSNGALSAAVTLRTCVLFGSSCVDVVTTMTGGAVTRVPGSDDPSLVPGLTPAQAAYLAQLKTAAPPAWTQIWLLVLAPTVLGPSNVFGPTAVFFHGGTASAVFALVTTDAAPLPPDPDLDGIESPGDNCAFTPNGDQLDGGGIGSASGADGIGDACQCGDVNADGRVTLSDAVLVTRSLLVPPLATLTRQDLCDVGGPPSPATQGCTITDAVLIRRALLQPPSATLGQVCPPALP